MAESFLPLKLAAAQIGISPEAVRGLCHRGRLAYVRKRGRLLVARDSVEAWIRRRAELDVPKGRGW